MPQDPAAALSALLRASSIQDHQEVLNAANAALRADKTDTASQHTRIVALLKLDRFDDVVRSIDEGGAKLQAVCGLENIYALYKLGRLDEALAALRQVGLEKRSYNHLAAQVAYRAERFDETRVIYQKLLDTDPGDEENDMNINSKAAIAQAILKGERLSPPKGTGQPPDSFELCYNEACVHIAQSAFSQAADLLQRAARLCDASDDLSEEDKEAEMQPILVQQAYVYARLGKEKEAQDLLALTRTEEGADEDIGLLVENNKAALADAPENPYLLQRKCESWPIRGKKSKLFQHQLNILSNNHLVIDLQAQKVRGVKDRTAATLSRAQHPSVQPGINCLSVLNAAAETHQASGKEITRLLRALSKKRPNDVGVVLTLIQIQLDDGHQGQAVSTLESFLSRLEQEGGVDAKDVRFSPGLVALAVSLFRTQGRESAAKNELVKSAQYWKTRPAGYATSLLREAGIELVRSSKSEDLLLAGSAFEKLFQENQGSHIAASGLIASLAPTDPDKVRQHASELAALEELVGDVNVSDLLKLGIAAAPKSDLAKKRPLTTEPDRRVTKKRRTRKLPKNYEEGKTPDPERWLPLRDRSSYRPKGKKGKKKAGESTQGGVVKEEETLELVGGGGVKVERAPVLASSNKKKKKGKK